MSDTVIAVKGSNRVVHSHKSRYGVLHRVDNAALGCSDPGVTVVRVL
jgi:hypothetical protein